MKAIVWIKNQVAGFSLLLWAEYQLFQRHRELVAYQRMTRQNQGRLAELWEEWELTRDALKKESLR